MGGIANAVGSIFGQTAQAFTPQNTYQSNVGGQDLNTLLKNSQSGLAQNQAQEQGLAGQLQNQANGQGPNPAQDMLNQATDQNAKQQAGAVASQKGINVGLAQKQINDNAAQAGQKAAGQGSLMQAQQSQGALNSLGSLYGNMANQNLSNQGQYEGVLNSANGVNAATSAQNAAATQNTMGGLLGAAGSALQFLNKGGTVQKFDGGGGVLGNYDLSNSSTPSTPWGQGVSTGMDNLDGSATTGAPSLSDSMSAWGGGLSQGMAPLTGGNTSPNAAAMIGGSLLQGMGGGSGSASADIANQMGAGMPHYEAGNGKKGGGVNPAQIASMAAMFAARGGQVPGEPAYKGNNPKNDIVPAVLSKGEIVLPNTVTKSANPGDKAKSFVEAIKDRDQDATKKGSSSSYAQVLAAKRKAGK